MTRVKCSMLDDRQVPNRGDGGPASLHRRQFLGCAGAGVLAALLPGCGGSIDNRYGQTIAWGRQAIATFVAQGVPAISIALLKSDVIVWQQAFGVISAAGTRATVETPFNIASVSKVFAALAAVILQDQNLIGLDTPIVEYVPGFSMLSPQYANITIRHLLSHSSGLPGNNSHNFLSLAPLSGYADDTFAALGNAHLKHPPGELAVYCNDGFTLFEQVVLAVTRLSFPAFVQQNIFDPLGMTRSGFPGAAQAPGVPPNARLDGKWYATPEYVNAYAAGGISSTPGDMMKFSQMLLAQGMYQGKRIASAAGIAGMALDQTQIVGVKINPTSAYPWGLGWDTGAERALQRVGVAAWQKNGDTTFSSSLFVLPGAQMALMASGYGGYTPAALAEEILLRALVEDGTIAALPAKISVSPAPPATAPAPGDAAGIYASCDSVLRVGLDTNTLTLDVWTDTGWASHPQSPFRYGSDGWWWSASGSGPGFAFAAVPDPDQTGNTCRYLMVRMADNAGYDALTAPVYQQLAANLPELDMAWTARMGTQWQVNNESADTIRSMTHAGVLQASVNRLPDLPGYIVMRNCDDSGKPVWQMLLPLADDRAGMAIRIPGLNGRDLWEAIFTAVNGRPAMTIGGVTYAPAG
ncbi:serine hydrolase domain-containing protein [Burkholderia sp. A9]|uniref:serine hydrolase domain-containing protein n=1 Tax=Burkholderia sp. A9 TaxID=1365108 RepID=UPI000A60B670|nr:serine hydrolase domain-containing protein [Burkholderia sp. A9]